MIRSNKNATTAMVTHDATMNTHARRRNSPTIEMRVSNMDRGHGEYRTNTI